MAICYRGSVAPRKGKRVVHLKGRSVRLLKLGIALAVLSVVLLGGLSGTTPDSARADQPSGRGNGARELSDRMRKADAPIVFADGNGLPVQALGDENRVPRVGDAKYWIALDDYRGTYYLKKFQLRAMSSGAEVWVALNLNFPTDAQTSPLTGKPYGYNDCRNGERTTITNEQLGYMLTQFDSNIRPTDVDWFGEPAKRTGMNAQLPGQVSASVGHGSNAYFDRTGRDVILVDNVRDDNYYDPNNEHTYSYIAGFFTTAMPYYHDRNVITIDAFDWLHRTHADPPHAPTTDPCTSAPARPFLYEGVFAHEYQHLIHNDYDPDELNWVNEGMSDFAEILTGYSTPSKHVDEKGADSHILNFLGWASVFQADWNPIPRPSGPENSLTNWGDQGDGEILGDYGHAYYFMTYLQSQGYGKAFFTSWAHNPLNGIDGLNSALVAAGSSDTFATLFADMQVSSLADAFIDSGATVSGEQTTDLQNTDANATIHFTGNAYNSAGAPPWGSDYIPLGPGASLGSVVFDGQTQHFFPSGPQWVENANGYFSVVPSGKYNSMMDVSITHEVTLSGSGQLTFSHYYDTELSWDFGFVQVSTDGGQTWQSLACTGTTSAHDPGAIASIVANMPGYTGTAGSAAAPLAASCDLSGIAAGPALVALRFMSDPSVNLTGWFVKDVKLNGTQVGTAGQLDDWNNQKAYDPASLGFTLRLVGLSGAVNQYGHVTAGSSVVVVDIPLNGSNDGSAASTQLAALGSSQQVFAIVSGIPEAEDNNIYGEYSLSVNATERADGAGLSDGYPW